MSIVTKTISTIDIILNYINKDLYSNLEDYCFLESVIGDIDSKNGSELGILTGYDGSLVSIIKLDGIKKIAEAEEIETTVEDLNKKLKSSFKEKGHSLQFYFSRDKGRTEDELNRLTRSYREEAKKMGMDADFIFDEKSGYLADKCCFEENLLVIWSRPALIDANMEKESEELNNELSKYPIFEKGQNFLLRYNTLNDKHKAFLSLILKSFKSVGISSSLLSVREQTNEIKRSISYELTSDKWSARSINSKKPVLRDNESDLQIKENDISYFLYPNLKKQFFPDKFYRKDGDTLKIGDKYVASMYVDIPQEDKMPFNEFIKSIDKDIPYQISFKIDGGGLSNIGLKKFLASILVWSPNSNNKEIKEALQYYEDCNVEGSAITKNNISLNTWAEDEKELSSRKSFLFKALQAWGSMTPYFSDNDTYESYLNAIPAFSPKMNGNNYIDLFEEVLYMLPLTRQANIWKEGCIINKTEEGKIMPYQVASSIQTTWNELIFAKPGSGKSVWANFSNWSFITTPKSDILTKGKLPFVSILDIGPSSLGLIKLLKMLLPESRHSEVIYKRLSNSEEDAINIFDTQLGCRIPNYKEREFLLNFLTLLLTPSSGKAVAGASEMISAVITELYKEFSDGKNPKLYEEYEEPDIDKKMRYLGISGKNRTWWYVVDELFKNKEYKLAKIAQRRAVPVISDMVKIANNNESIRKPYSKVTVESGETLLEYFNRSVSEIVRDFPIINSHTILDLSSARVISLDLNDVAPEGDPGSPAQKQANIFYMLGRFAATRNFFISPDTFKSAPNLYEKYLKETYTECRITPKRLSVDELHRTNGIPNFRSQIKRDMREGRKWKLTVCLISQLLDDFDKDMKELCTSKFILSSGDNYADIAAAFDMSGEVVSVLRTELTGPGIDGVPFVAKFSTKQGEYTQFLYNALSPIEMWCFTSTTEDVRLVEMLEVSFTSKNVYKILGETFPSGSCVGHLEKLNNSGKITSSESPMEYIVDKIKKKYSKMKQL